MKRLLIFLTVIFTLTMPVSAKDITAPEVPESGKALLPEEPETPALKTVPAEEPWSEE